MITTWTYHVRGTRVGLHVPAGRTSPVPRPAAPNHAHGTTATATTTTTTVPASVPATATATASASDSRFLGAAVLAVGGFEFAVALRVCGTNPMPPLRFGASMQFPCSNVERVV